MGPRGRGESRRSAVADLSLQGGFCTRWPVLPSLLPQRLREGSRRSCSPGGNSRRHRQDKAGRGNRNCTCILPKSGILGRVLQTRGEEEPRRTLRCPLLTRRSSAPSVASLSQRLPSPCGSLTGCRGVSTSSCWEGNRRGKAGTRLCFAARECELRAERSRQPSPPRQLRRQRLTGDSAPEHLPGRFCEGASPCASGHAGAGRPLRQTLGKSTAALPKSWWIF